MINQRETQSKINRLVILPSLLISTLVEIGILMIADQILVLESGQIIERGTHSDLLAPGGRYAAMWQAQQNTHHWKILA
ncbi:MAG: hypothetical protein HC936_14830 [Leptolyngbyaceae cyanobacterium SU_3_3]|nr:hypothetical protein [Leptolyngbyaceae cyanobacterium SU_3_3]NJR49226.1 hypothetical protein [Leptolyngbyaceae cyanobacterium CSU_1_3]